MGARQRDTTHCPLPKLAYGLPKIKCGDAQEATRKFVRFQGSDGRLSFEGGVRMGAKQLGVSEAPRIDGER
jgi:hypothetical protein